MDFSVIIAEYNPFHKGHAYLIDKVKNDAPIVVIMSGAFVQRGESAISDKYLRASSAIKAGADIVLELPIPFSIAPAEKFAQGAFKLISSIDGDIRLCFGSESGDKEKLLKTAEITYSLPKEIENDLKSNLKKGLSFPKSRDLAISDYANDRQLDLCDLSNANDVLGIEYINAAKKCGLKMDINVIKRTGSHNSLDINDHPSASAIRSLLKQGDFDKAYELLPSYSHSLIDFYKNFSFDDRIILNALTDTDISSLFDVTVGLDNRISKSIYRAKSFEEAFAKMKSSRYSDSRLRRICLYALLGITKDVFKEAEGANPIFNVLAAKKDSLKYLDRFNGKITFTQNELSKNDDILSILTARSQEKFNIINGNAIWKSELI